MVNFTFNKKVQGAVLEVTVAELRACKASRTKAVICMQGTTHNLRQQAPAPVRQASTPEQACGCTVVHTPWPSSHFSKVFASDWNELPHPAT